MNFCRIFAIDIVVVNLDIFWIFWAYFLVVLIMSLPYFFGVIFPKFSALFKTKVESGRFEDRLKM